MSAEPAQMTVVSPVATDEIPAPPDELGGPGRAMWDDMLGALEIEDPRELISLRQACLLEDDLVRLRDELEGADLVVKGSTGQPVEQPLLGAIRNAVTLQSKLLGAIARSDAPASATQAGRRLALQRHQ